MQELKALLQKMLLITESKNELSVIDKDVMIDYTKKLYDEILNLRINQQTVVPIADAEKEYLQLDIKEEDIVEPAFVFMPEKPAMPTTPPPTPPVDVILEPVAAIVPEVIPEPQKVALPPLPIPEPPAKDIRKYIDLNDKYLFLGELFLDDIRYYEDSLNKLNKCKDRYEALDMLGVRFQDETNPAFANFHHVLDSFFDE